MKSRNEDPNLDYLRAFAVLLVLGSHLLIFFRIPSGIDWHTIGFLGYAGVLFFFVHTSLVLMFSLERQQSKFQGVKLFSAFWLRRGFRIYPLSIAVVLTGFLLRLPVERLKPGHLLFRPVSKWGLLANLLLVQNLHQSYSIPGPLWSLPYEMQMYIFLPFLFLLARRVKSSRPLILLWLLSVGLATLYLRVGHMPDLVKYIPCFLPGIIAYKEWENQPARWSSLGWPLALACLSALAAASFTDEKGWLVCLVIGLAVPRFAEMRNAGLRTATHIIAKYSYGIYLTHTFCIWLAFMRLSRLRSSEQWAVFALTATLLPVLVYHTLEQPMIRLGNRAVERLCQPAPEAALEPAYTVLDPSAVNWSGPDSSVDAAFEDADGAAADTREEPAAVLVNLDV